MPPLATERARRRCTTALAGAALALAAAAVPAAAQQSLAVSYSLTYSPGPPPVVVGTTLHLQGAATGSLTTSDPALNARLNPLTWSDQAVADLTTGLLDGSFVMTFATGDRLFGDLFENVSQLLPTNGIGPYTQQLTIRGGTGLFAGASGMLSGNGVGTATGSTASGTGTVALAPEPTPVALLATGLIGLLGVTVRRPRRGLHGRRT
jgi:hypothetical protein